MTNMKSLIWIAAPVACAAAFYASAAGLRRYAEHIAIQSAPALDCPETLDLGRHERGEVVVARFALSNRGGSDLLIDDVRRHPACGCSAVEREIDGKWFPVESLWLSPGEQVGLALRASINGQAGAPKRFLIEFHTNDPGRPEATIGVVVPEVTSGVATVPSSVVVGTVPVGREVRQILTILDDALKPRSVERVTSSNPERVTVRLLPADASHDLASQGGKGVPIGRLEVVVDTRTLGSADAAIQIHLAGEERKPDSIPVVGRVAAAVEATPASLVLPRTSGGGPIYFANCWIRSINSQPLDLSPDPLPPGLTAEVIPGDAEASVRVVRITWDPEKGRDLAGKGPHPVRFKTKAGDAGMTLEVSVDCRPGGG
jgi:hypothetical protein